MFLGVFFLFLVLDFISPHQQFLRECLQVKRAVDTWIEVPDAVWLRPPEFEQRSAPFARRRVRACKPRAEWRTHGCLGVDEVLAHVRTGKRSLWKFVASQVEHLSNALYDAPGIKATIRTAGLHINHATDRFLVERIKAAAIRLARMLRGNPTDADTLRRL